MTCVYLSLGSNMGDCQSYLGQAIEALSQLPNTEMKAVSSLYETPAWGNTNQANFLNLACQLETDLEPLDLLECIHQIEADLGRVRHEKWGPRTIDIDILLFGQLVMDSEVLTIPHLYMTERAFVLVPLLEIAPNLIIPGKAWSVKDLLTLIDRNEIAFWGKLS
ncbi:2-amino-4-hydroxy-6-hydroxymethyldihydropteridine diphosphokinase [Streptococcus bovimastitidis]|uniref:2-amino-4-hydroxy-6-hydroxymethyldihydropteridine diphosphokinase n=1 Tax=Streptococcus bovimastitidis TaxID=1856638 RepID=A0A1L8MP75_9STRE|nr:2-amino-4-hydroxy-6-hydroxymethyldihydropteridine diphosphokinase [Streptococcus bovimastitidis]OJF72561.1 2-amino-4-hydroxy-6-hydroxymethyldihydropteridine diphosphokinase [Streptococcus bovimastitidis]